MACILMVEDEADLRELLTEELESEGHEVAAASDGHMALEKLATFAPELVISDISMPGMGGFELLETFRASYPALADTPFLFLTALADRQDELHARQLGVDDYLTKPIDFDMLHSVLATRLRQVARMKDRKEQQMLKLYTALSDKPARPDSQPVTVSQESSGIATIPAREDGRNIAHDTGHEYEIDAALDLHAASPVAAIPETPFPEEGTGINNSAESASKRVFGSLFKFPNLASLEQKTPCNGQSLPARTIARAAELLKLMVCDDAVVLETENSEIIVSYREADEAASGTMSRKLGSDLQSELIDDRQEVLKQEQGLTDEMINRALLVSESLFEIKLSREELATQDAFEKSILNVIERTRNNPHAPNLLASSIKKDKGYLAQLKLIASNDEPLPICFFNYDEASKQKIRACFAFFADSNREKASYLIDVLTLDLMGNAARRICPRDIAVVDVHFDTLATSTYATAYIRKFLAYAENTSYAFMLNIRSTPREMTAARLEEILHPLGKYGARRSIQINPAEIVSFAEVDMPVSCLVCSHPELIASPGSEIAIPQAKRLLGKSGKLLVLRGVPNAEMIEDFKSLDFDGYAVETTRDI